MPRKLSKLFTCLGGLFDVDGLNKKYKNLEGQALDPNLWQNKNNAEKVLKEKRRVEEKLEKFSNIENTFNDSYEMYQLAKEEKDENIISDTYTELQKLYKSAKKFEIECLFSGDTDNNNAFLEINAGAGGTESHDWAQIMMRMYLRFAERLGFKTEIINLLDGEDAGIKSCIIKIKGSNAYGWFKTESGVHRLVRISPFNAAGKRMTSFASAFVYPEIEDDVEINIQDKDLRIDTFKSSGAGGQHVNTTDSAVRITHIPTNIVVQSQSNRSQHKNRAEAIKVLKAQLYKLEMRKKEEELENTNASKSEIGWGHQIRSYVMQPYQMVKDLRTNFETSDTQGILDGDLEKFVYSNLAKEASTKNHSQNYN